MNVRRNLQTLRAMARRAADKVTSPIGSLLRFTGVENTVALTFDDGPDPDVTPRLIGLLDEMEIRATFFMLCCRVQRFPELAESVRSAGHEVALHGLDHTRMTEVTPPEAYSRLVRAKQQLEGAMETSILWYRPPYGAHNLTLWRQVRSLGMQMVLWGPTLRDSVDLTAEERWRTATARPGDIVLAHDGVAGPMDGVDDPPPAAIDRIGCLLEVVERYKSMGLTFSTLSQLAAVGRPVRGARWTK